MLLLLLCYCVAIVMLKCVTFLLVTKRFIFLIRHLHHLLLLLLLMMLTGSGIISWLEANSRDIFNLSESRKQLLTHLFFILPLLHYPLCTTPLHVKKQKHKDI